MVGSSGMAKVKRATSLLRDSFAISKALLKVVAVALTASSASRHFCCTDSLWAGATSWACDNEMKICGEEERNSRKHAVSKAGGDLLQGCNTNLTVGVFGRCRSIPVLCDVYGRSRTGGNTHSAILPSELESVVQGCTGLTGKCRTIEGERKGPV